MKNDLPAWAEAAIAAQEATQLRPRLIQRWREVEADVLPALDGLDDVEKQWVLDAALWAAKYWQQEAADRHRKAITAAKNQLERIADLADELAARLNTLDLITEDNDLSADRPSFWELLESVAESEPGYLDWLHVMKGYGHWRDFIRTAQFQSRPGPGLADLLAELASSIRAGYSFNSRVQPAITTRKASAVPVRILIMHLRDNLAYLLRQKKYTLPDQAIATLAAVLFDMDPPPTAEAIKALRTRMKENP